MCKATFRPPNDHSAFKLWAKYTAITAAIVFVVWLLVGCSTPGKVGFRQLHQQNVSEKHVLKAIAVHADNIGRHADRGLKLTDDLAHSRLDPAQAKELDEIRVEFNAVKGERDALTQKLLAVTEIVVQRDATIVQTQAEVRAALRDSWWTKMKIRATWLGIGLALGSVAVWIFRKTIRLGVVAAEAEVPGLAKL